MFTNNLKKIVTRRKKRVGRGYGSGVGGHTSGRGQKGQTSRAGYSRPKGFEGGQARLNKRIPVKRGFKTVGSNNVTAVRITKLLDKNLFQIDAAALSSITSSKNTKLVGSGNYEGYDLKKVVVKNEVRISSSLKKAIVEAGGTVEE